MRYLHFSLPLQPKSQQIHMAYRRITAAEAAEMIKDRDTLALSGFTPNGNPKAIFRELSKRAIRLHEQGEEFGIGILTGASSCQSVEGDMAAAKALRFRAPFSTNKDFRTHTNLGEVEYEDMHLGHMAEKARPNARRSLHPLVVL